MIMCSLAVLFAVITGSKIINCESTQHIGIDAILDLTKLQDKNYQDRENNRGYGIPQKSNNYGSLKSQEIRELVQYLAQKDFSKPSYYKEVDSELNDHNNIYYMKNNKKVPNKVNFGNSNDRKKDLDKTEFNEGVYDNNLNDDSYKHSRFNEVALEKLLSSNVLDKKYHKKPKLLPNSLVGSYDSLDHSDDESSNTEDYSKIFLILNPEAIKKSRNKEQLDSLLRKILSATTSRLKIGKRKKSERHYKKNPTKETLLSRRAYGDSREIGGNEVIEDAYKPKRIRSERGGGLGAGGRTAIPYVKNRGDIYERDN